MLRSLSSCDAKSNVQTRLRHMLLKHIAFAIPIAVRQLQHTRMVGDMGDFVRQQYGHRTTYSLLPHGQGMSHCHPDSCRAKPAWEFYHPQKQYTYLTWLFLSYPLRKWSYYHKLISLILATAKYRDGGVATLTFTGYPWWQQFFD